jgi:hypothetical protein
MNAWGGETLRRLVYYNALACVIVGREKYCFSFAVSDAKQACLRRYGSAVSREVATMPRRQLSLFWGAIPPGAEPHLFQLAGIGNLDEGRGCNSEGPENFKTGTPIK